MARPTSWLGGSAATAAILGRGAWRLPAAAVDRVLDSRLDLMDTAVDDLLRAWYQDPVKGLLCVLQ